MLFDRSTPVYLVLNDSTDPPFNLACEEYLFQKRRENFIMLWRNAPSIIIGRNQNAYAELDMDYVREHSIPVIRRLTGGGAVYHDLGNLNYTFITAGEGLADFGEYLKPVIGYLRSLGLNAAFGGRNDILLDGMKISGNAQAACRGRVMMHGTLLFSVSLNILEKALKPNELKLKSKGIASVRSRVTNIGAHLAEEMTVGEFKDGLTRWLTEVEHGNPYEFDEEDRRAVETLVREKYGTAAWNIGSAPAYSMEGTAAFPGGLVTACFDVRDGLIDALKLTGDFFGVEDIAGLEGKITGAPHERSALLAVLEKADVGRYMAGITADGLVSVFFS